MAYPSVTYTFTNGTTADGANVSTNFTNLVSGFSDGTKDFNMNAGTLAGNFTCNGNVVLGNATSDTIALTGIITINTSGSYLANQLGTALLPTYTFSGDLNTGIWSSGADNLSLSTAGVQRINVDANGDIQIGAITAPVNSSAGRKYVTIEALTTAPAVIQFGNATGGAGVAMGQLEFYNRDNTGSSSFRSAYMQVGVEGSTANNRGSYFVFGVKADGVSGSGSTAFKINNASQAEASLGAVTTPGYSFSGDLNTGMWSSGADTLNFSTGGVQAMKISSAQYVGFSQTTPAFRVDVLSTAAAGDALRLGQDGDGPTVLRIDNNASEAGNRNWVLRNRFTAIGQLEIGVSTAKGGATFTNVMTLDSAGQVGIGLTPTTRNNTRLQIVDGIGFPATQVSSSDANTLDDYEEGTWTPSVGGNATYTKQVGTYTKIGRHVYFSCLLHINAIGTGSATTVSGLPFTAAAGDATYGINVSYWTSAVGTFVYLGGEINASSTNFIFYGATAATASLTVPVNVFQNSTLVRVSGHYIV